MDGIEHLQEIYPAVSVFGSASIAETDPVYEMGRKVGRLLAESGFFGGHRRRAGAMEAANRGAFEAKGKSVGLNITSQRAESESLYVISIDFVLLHQKGDVRQIRSGVRDFFRRIRHLDELFEAMTLIQTNRIKPFPSSLLGKDYWKDLLAWIKKTCS